MKESLFKAKLIEIAPAVVDFDMIKFQKKIKNIKIRV